MNEVKESKRTLVTTQIDVPLQNTNNDRKIRSFMLQFNGAKCIAMLKSLNRCIERIVPIDFDTRITYNGHKLNIRFKKKIKLTKFINTI